MKLAKHTYTFSKYEYFITEVFGNTFTVSSTGKQDDFIYNFVTGHMYDKYLNSINDIDKLYVPNPFRIFLQELNTDVINNEDTINKIKAGIMDNIARSFNLLTATCDSRDELENTKVFFGGEVAFMYENDSDESLSITIKCSTNIDKLPKNYYTTIKLQLSVGPQEKIDIKDVSVTHEN